MIATLILAITLQVPGPKSPGLGKEKQVPKPSARSELKVGDKIRLVAPRGFVPGLYSEASYRRFVSAVQLYRSEEYGNDEGERRILALWPKGMRPVTSGSEADVLAIHRVRKYPVPVVEVDMRGKRLWVPVDYVEGMRGGNASRFPVLTIEYENPYPGLRTNLIGVNKSPVPVCVDIFAFRDYAQAQAAGDADGKAILRKNSLAFDVSDGVPVLIREYHEDAGGSGIDAVEIRVLEGDKKGRGGWIPVGNIEPGDIKRIRISPFNK